jgi:hypothetical protein
LVSTQRLELGCCRFELNRHGTGFHHLGHRRCVRNASGANRVELPAEIDGIEDRAQDQQDNGDAEGCDRTATVPGLGCRDHLGRNPARTRARIRRGDRLGGAVQAVDEAKRLESGKAGCCGRLGDPLAEGRIAQHDDWHGCRRRRLRSERGRQLSQSVFQRVRVGGVGETPERDGLSARHCQQPRVGEWTRQLDGAHRTPAVSAGHRSRCRPRVIGLSNGLDRAPAFLGQGPQTLDHGPVEYSPSP